MWLEPHVRKQAAGEHGMPLSVQADEHSARGPRGGGYTEERAGQKGERNAFENRWPYGETNVCSCKRP